MGGLSLIGAAVSGQAPALTGRLEAETVFLDRDGVINRKMPDGAYVTRWEEFAFLPGAVDALRRLKAARLRVIVVTNQRGVARGFLTHAALDGIHRHMIDSLRKSDAGIDAVYACAHDEGQCTCRKPQPGLFLRARDDFPDIDFARSVVIGDALTDLEVASALGCRSILICDPQRRPDILREAARRRLVEDRTAGSLQEAVARYLLPSD